MRTYCPKCNKLSETNIQSMDEVFEIKGEKITVTSEVAICNVCGNKVFNQKLDDKTLEKIEKHRR